ncbi:MAG: hypothetical protein ACOYYU_10275 [Chloroflexota bacterium]
MTFRPTLRVHLLILAMLLPGLACRAVTGFLDEEEQFAAPTPPTAQVSPVTGEPQQDAGLACPSTTSAILAAATEFYEDDSGEEEAEEPEEQYLVTYLVTGDEISDPYFEDIPQEWVVYQEDEATHREIWGFFTNLIPLEERAALAEFSIVTDGQDNLLAAVAQTYNDPERWALEVDILDTDDKRNLAYTLIHEYAHLLTLGPSQVTPSLAIFDNPDDEDIYYQEASACPQYFPGEGCAQPDAYLNDFFDRFWVDIYAEWQDVNLIEDDDAYYEALDEFYYKYEDHFVTDYAATNPEEDIAEAFAFFVLSPRPAGNTIAEEKMLFFYEYPELARVREQIVANICASNR